MDDGFGYWLAGFADGEGCFSIGRNQHGARYCVFRIGLHRDDAPILREIVKRTGLGRTWVGQSPSMKSPAALWTVTRKGECLQLVELFERYPLRAKKRRDFAIWAAAVRVHATMTMNNGNQHSGGRPNDYSEMDRLRDELQAGRVRRGGRWTPSLS